MEGIKALLKRKNIEISAKRYGIDALGAMAQGLFASLLIGTIINTVGTQFGIGFLTQAVVTVGSGEKAVAYTVGGLVSQGIGTSMLQMGNIVRNPRIWIPPTLASAITGPIATCLFHFQMNGAPISSGMGTCGLVGQIGVYTGWVNDVASGAKAGITSMDWIAMVLVCFVLPAVLSVVFCEVLRRMGWIKENDLKLD